MKLKLVLVYNGAACQPIEQEVKLKFGVGALKKLDFLLLNFGAAHFNAEYQFGIPDECNSITHFITSDLDLSLLKDYASSYKLNGPPILLITIYNNPEFSQPRFPVNFRI